MRDVIAERGVGSRGKLKLLGTFLLLLVLIAALMAIPAIWAH
jgi:hypothetical protein